MDTNKLRYFITIAQTGSMRKASEILNISAPALSKATKLLEEEVGVKLIVQDGRNIAVTDEGKKLVHKGGEILKQLDLLQEEISEDKNITQLKIATFEVFSTYFLQFLDLLEWDEKQLTMHEMNPGEIEKAVAGGLVDFGITYLPVPHPDLDFLKVRSIDMGVFIKQSSFKGLEQKELPFVVPAIPLHGNPTRVKGLDGWPESNYQRKIKYQVTLLESALELCRQGRAAGYFPKFIIKLHNQRVAKSRQLIQCKSRSGKTCKTDVYIVKRKSNIENKTIKQMAKALRILCDS
jgi:DNA-binding transcriptional LysR family regulator